MKKRVTFIQPAVPHYRVPFFNILSNNYKVAVYHSGDDLNNSNSFQEKKVSKLIFLKMFIFQIIPFRKVLAQSDIIIINGNLRNLSNILLIILCIIYGKRIIWWGHLISAFGHKYRIKFRIFLSQLCSHTLFYTENEAVVARMLVRSKKDTIGWMSNGLDLNTIKKHRLDYDPSIRKTDIIFCGRFTEKSNLSLLLDALVRIKQPLKAKLIGDTNKQAEEMQAHYKAKLNHHNISIIEETNNEKELAAYFNDAKLFVYPGAAGLSIIHSLSYGLPILVHNKWEHHMPEITVARDYGAGFLFECNQVTDLAEKIISLLGQTDCLKTVSTIGLKITEDTFNIECMAENLIKVIEND